MNRRPAAITISTPSMPPVRSRTRSTRWPRKSRRSPDGKTAVAPKETAPAGHDILGNGYILQGNWAAAEAEQNQAQALVPQHYIGKSLRAMIAAGQGNKPAAESAI